MGKLFSDKLDNSSKAPGVVREASRALANMWAEPPVPEVRWAMHGGGFTPPLSAPCCACAVKPCLGLLSAQRHSVGAAARHTCRHTWELFSCASSMSVPAKRALSYNPCPAGAAHAQVQVLTPANEPARPLLASGTWQLLEFSLRGECMA